MNYKEKYFEPIKNKLNKEEINILESYYKNSENFIETKNKIKTNTNFSYFNFFLYTPKAEELKENYYKVFKILSLITNNVDLALEILKESNDNLDIEYIEKTDEIFFTYLNIIMNTVKYTKQILINKEIPKNLNDEKEYQKHIKNMDKIYNTTNSNDLKIQILYIKYIHDQNENYLDEIKKIINLSKIDKQKDFIMLITYTLYKINKIHGKEIEEKIQQIFINHSTTIYSIYSNISYSSIERMNFYMNEFNDLSTKMKLNEKLLKTFLKNVIIFSYGEKKILKELMNHQINQEYIEQLLEIIKTFDKKEDMIKTLIINAYLIKKAKDLNIKTEKHIKYFEDKFINNIFKALKEKKEYQEIKQLLKTKNILEHDYQKISYFIHELSYSLYFEISAYLLLEESNICGNYIKLNYHLSEYILNIIGLKYQSKNVIDQIISIGENQEYIINLIESDWIHVQSLSDDIKKDYLEYIEKNELLEKKLNKNTNYIIYKDIFNYYIKKPIINKKIIVESLSSKSKKIRDLIIENLKGKNEYDEELQKLSKQKLPKANKEELEYLIIYNKINKFDTKNNSIVNLIKELYNPKIIDKKLEKLNIIDIPKIKYEQKNEYIDEIVIKYYISSFLLSPKVELPLLANEIKEKLCKNDLNTLGKYVYNIWQNNGAKAKEKMAMVFAVYNCDDEFIIEFKKQIDEWALNMRGAIAAEGIKALSFHGSDYALMQLDTISRKYKHKKVKETAKEYFYIAAKNMGLTSEELSDKVIPNLGFDTKGEIELNYGNRKFIGKLNKDLTIQIYDQEGKKLKTLPKPNKSDDEQIAKTTKKEFTNLKKQLKTVIESQKLRLERAIFITRKWNSKTFKEVFKDNPIMNIFATGLIWGIIDQNQKIQKTFRYMEDGTFENQEYDQIKLKSEDQIVLIHPFDITEKQINEWKENLQDNEIEQPVNQLNIKLIKLTQEEQEKHFLKRYKGKKMYVATLINRLEKLGWSKNSITDGGGYSGFHLQFDELKYGAQIHGSDLYIGGIDETTEIEELAFYKKEEIERGSYLYDDLNENNTYKIKNVDKKFLNAVLNQLDEVIK
ncbi:DUF4132 domain-containing protein [Oceanotoga sp. DSM 15011]|uniref:DUF4132 domain-containing protein n=1 Tax=Oceanotoga sp. DSM 15011 TaxID=2984951 RepID=UPI0021F4F0DD|nr:DUF4132 domain-containing protein [Oceanotoga sp. DSM 15011]UYO99126.1 DUF4132 domain-containing protein [Oceanotoga sp. DSM 15011]